MQEQKLSVNSLQKAYEFDRQEEQILEGIDSKLQEYWKNAQTANLQLNSAVKAAVATKTEAKAEVKAETKAPSHESNLL